MWLKKITKVQWILIIVFVMFFIYFVFGERIFETDIAKAKMDIFKTLLQDDPEEAKENIKNILDTLINQ